MIDGLFEWRKIVLDDLKHTVDIDPEVLVGDEVAESGDIDPGNLGC